MRQWSIWPPRFDRPVPESARSDQEDAASTLARGRMKTKRAALIEALTGRLDDHRAEIARMLLDQIDALSIQIDQLTLRAEQLLAAMSAAQAPNQRDHHGGQPPGAAGSSGLRACSAPLGPPRTPASTMG